MRGTNVCRISRLPFIEEAEKLIINNDNQDGQSDSK